MKQYKEYQHHFPVVLKSFERKNNLFILMTEDNYGSTLSLELGLFCNGIIRVRTAKERFAVPEYPIVSEDLTVLTDLEVRELEESYTIITDQYEIVIYKDPYTFKIYHKNGKIACKESINDVDSVGDGYNQIPPTGYSVDDQTVKGMNIGFTIHYDEKIYGFGEHFSNFNRVGQRVKMENFDTLGCRDEKAYKNIPFYISTYGYGLYVHNHSVFDFNVGTESLATLSVHVPSESLEYYIIVNESLKDILSAYMNMTGPAALPPKWSFGLWYSTGFQGNSRENTIQDAMRFREEKIPCDVIHFDCYWLREDMWCDFVWDDKMYPDRVGMISELKKMGYKICLWINPYVTVTTEMFREGTEKGYFAKDLSGRPYRADLWHGLLSECVLLDFTNPEAVRWFQDKIKNVLEEGIDVLKTDFGEDIPYNACFYNGMTGKELRNIYSRLYNKAVFEIIKECKGQENALVWARSGCAGMQQFPVCWCGDPRSGWEGMAASLRAGLSMAMSGVPFWSHDMGGFYGNVTKEVFVRWSQFGLFSSHSRLHGTTTRQPWAYDDETKNIIRDFVQLRYRLLPYIWKTAKQCVSENLPFIRPMILECENDKNVQDICDQYFFGPDIIVAPVFGGNMAERSVYLPEGEWEEMLGDNRRFSGGKWYTFRCALDYLPLFRRCETTIEMQDVKMSIE